MKITELRPIATRGYRLRSGGQYNQTVVTIPHIWLEQVGQDPANLDMSVRMYTTEQGWLVLVPVDGSE